MLLKNGRRCKNGASRNGLCVMHTKQVQEEKRKIDKLLEAGKYAAALAALAKLVETVVKTYQIVAPYVASHMSHLVFSQHAICGESSESTIPISLIQEVTARVSKNGEPEAVRILAPLVFGALLEGQVSD